MTPRLRQDHGKGRRPARKSRAGLAAVVQPFTINTGPGSPPACGRCGGCHTGAPCIALRFVLPMPLNLANSRAHWRTKHKARQQYMRTLDGLLLVRALPPVPRQPIDQATVWATLHLGAWMDDDNAVARCKWPLDWLVRAKYLEDDRRSVLRWGAFPEQYVSRKVHPMLLLTIVPCPAGQPFAGAE